VAFTTLSSSNNASAVRDYWYYDSNSQCSDIEFVFARGSGLEYDGSSDYLAFKDEMESTAKALHASYNITDLNYEAVGLKAGNILGIYVSAGESYSFGRSVADGVYRLREYYNSKRGKCRNTHWVFAGYSQGAMVVANILFEYGDMSNVVYVGLFGDPKLYLPEGVGAMPDACKNENLSPYRVRVPNCFTDDGILRARKPYEAAGYEGKFGLWCNDDDFICGSSKTFLNTIGHTNYDTTGAYAELGIIVQERLTELCPDSMRHLLSYEGGSVGGRVKAITNTKRIWLSDDELLYIDGSKSVSTDGSSLEYTWIINDEVVSRESILAGRHFKCYGTYVVTLKVASASFSDSTDILVIYGSWQDEVERLPAPSVKTMARSAHSFRLSWDDSPAGARYLGIRLNDYILGYTDAKNSEIVIDDVVFDNLQLDCFWLSESLEMGEFSEVDVDVALEFAPSTDASWEGWRIIAIVSLPFCGALALAIFNKLVRDIRKIKSAPRADAQEAHDEKSELYAKSVHASDFESNSRRH